MRRLALVLALSALTGSAAAVEPHPEQQLLAALDQWNNGHVHAALSTLDGLVKREPNFRLAQLLYGDLLAVKGGARALRLASDDPRLKDLVQEARLRLLDWRTAPAPDDLPDALLQLAPISRHALVVDLARNRLYSLEHRNGRLRVVGNYYAGIGKNGTRKRVAGDNRTPVGVYDITGWMDDGGLPELYGAGAFPLNYPNVWDRRERRNGFGIWLHGVPRDTYARPPRSSEGCVTLANADLLALRGLVTPGQTPVVLSDGLRWIPAQEAQALRDEMLATLERWRSRWSTRDTEGYLAYYAPDFTTDGMNRKTFAEYKRRVNAGKRFIQVAVRDVELLRYPGDEPMVLARFTQDYRSDNLARTTQKQQFWRREADGWKIIMEENR